MAKLEQVESEGIAAIGYDSVRHRLRVQYRGSRRLYDYLNVPPQEYRALQEAESKGRYVNFRIKPRYKYEVVRH